MSRGLGTAQRRLLITLYTAALQPLLRWDLENDGEALPLAVPRRPPTDGPSESEFYLLSQFGLAETHHPVLRESARRSVQAHRNRSWDWYSLNEHASTADERDVLRTWRAAYRRAANSLADRGLIESVHADAYSGNLGQWSSGTFDYEGITRKVLLARITDAGRRYIQDRRTEFVAEADDNDHIVHTALRCAGFLDIAEPEPASPTRRPQGLRRSRTDTRPRRQPVPISVEAPEPPVSPRALGYDELITSLVAKGFELDAIHAAARAWRREERRRTREQFQGHGIGKDYGIPLNEYMFGPEEIEQITKRIAE